MKDSTNHDPPSAAAERNSGRVQALLPYDGSRARSQPRLPELVGIILLVVGCGTGLFWMNRQAGLERNALAERLEAISAEQAQRIAKLEAEIAEVHRAFKITLTDELPAVITTLAKRIDENHRSASDAINNLRAVPREAQREPQPTEKNRSQPEKSIDLLREASLSRANLPLTTEEMPSALQPEDIKTPPLRKPLEIHREGERDLQNEMHEDFTNKSAPRAEN